MLRHNKHTLDGNCFPEKLLAAIARYQAKQQAASFEEFAESKSSSSVLLTRLCFPSDNFPLPLSITPSACHAIIIAAREHVSLICRVSLQSKQTRHAPS